LSVQITLATIPLYILYRMKKKDIIGFPHLKVEYLCRDVDAVGCEGWNLRSFVGFCIVFLMEAFWRRKGDG
jgi:hypothetical protein